MNDLQKEKIKSTIDGTWQPFLYSFPEELSKKVPVLMALHTWSYDYTAELEWFPEASRRGWIYVQPNFRGPNWTPQSCGSKLAMQDVIDTLDWTLQNPMADSDRVYVAGASGGGHMGMMLLSHYPDRFAAGTVWCGISDLKSWRLFHTRDDGLGCYAQHIDKTVGGLLTAVMLWNVNFTNVPRFGPWRMPRMYR